MIKTGQYPQWMFIIFPALAMMLGWGLRGHIGGGPFGAMIPGAMLALSMGLLCKMPAAATSFLLVFGVFGIGMGGEMTYGQTLGFLRSPETLAWGTAGTIVKGAVWGLLGGAVLSLGLVFEKIPKRKIIIAILLLITGIFLGFKLINDPMLLYFSDPENPRAESWAGLLLGAVFLLSYLKIKIPSAEFRIIFRFAFWGMAGGALGFGLGGLWLFWGSQLPGVIFTSWWKAMEFTFGLLLGASFGYAAWLSRGEPVLQNGKEDVSSETKIYTGWKEAGVVLANGLLIYWLIPSTMEWFAKTTIINNMAGGTISKEIARIMVNYSVAGLLFVLVIMRFPKAAWQIGITLTFCHASIDLIRDFYPDINTWSPFNFRFFYIFLMTTGVGLLTHYFSRRTKVVARLFLLLIWACIMVSVLRLFIDPEKLNVEGLSFYQIVFGKFIVDIIFALSAVVVSWFIIRKFQLTKS